MKRFGAQVRADKEQLKGVILGGNASACVVLHRCWTQMRMFLQGKAATRDALLFNKLIHAKKTNSTSAIASTIGRRKQSASNNAREIHIRHATLVFGPVVAVLLRAPVLVPQGAVDDHDGEEGGVEVRHWRVEAAGEPPACCHDPVGEIVWLAGEAVPVRCVTNMQSRERSVTETQWRKRSVTETQWRKQCVTETQWRKGAANQPSTSNALPALVVMYMHRMLQKYNEGKVRPTWDWRWCPRAAEEKWSGGCMCRTSSS